MPLDLATLPDLPESTPDHDHASEPANDPAAELEPEPAPLSAETAFPAPLEIAVPTQEIQEDAVYPQDHFIHALYGGFMGMPDLPGGLLRTNLWDSLLEAYTNPNFSHHFAHITGHTA